MNWGQRYPLCRDGLLQSPINLIKRDCVFITGVLKIEFETQTSKSVLITNTGCTVDFKLKYLKGIPTISGEILGNYSYELDTIHFHWGSKNTYGSEHQINGRTFPLESHIIFKNKKSNRITIIGVVYQVSGSLFLFSWQL